MRIEGAYTLPATIDCVFATLLDPDILKRIIPGCERLIQLGPATPAGDLAFEALIRGEHEKPLTLTILTNGVRRPDHVQLAIRGHSVAGPISGQVLVDLVEQGSHTPGAYVLALATPDIDPLDCQRAITGFCEHLADYLYSRSMGTEADASGNQAEVPAESLPPVASGRIRYQPRPGHIVALPSRWSLGHLGSGSARVWRQRALWMGAGMLIGISALIMAAILVRWLGDQQE